jgi:hypothetical protein
MVVIAPVTGATCLDPVGQIQEYTYLRRKVEGVD